LPDARSSSQTGGVPGAAASVTYGIGLFALFIVAKNALAECSARRAVIRFPGRYRGDRPCRAQNNSQSSIFSSLSN